MIKAKAVELFGTQTALANAVGVGKAAVNGWPLILPDRIADRVIAACVRTGRDPKFLLNSHVDDMSVADIAGCPMNAFAACKKEGCGWWLIAEESCAVPVIALFNAPIVITSHEAES